MRGLLAAAACAVAVLAAGAAGPAAADTTALRIDPEALSGRIAQYLLGESEVGGGPPAPAVFGANIRLNDEPFAQPVSQTEPSIAAVGSTAVAGFHDLFPTTHDFVCRFASSADAGATWRLGGATPLQAQGNFCSDPGLAAGPDGTFYYSYLDINFGATRSDVVVARSTDGGRTFGAFSVAAHGAPRTNFPDKELIAADTGAASPHRGTIYVSWTDFLNPQDKKALDNGQIKVVVSRDGGRTWSAPVAISHSAQFPEAISGSLPVVAPDGTVYVFYADFRSGTGPLAIKYSRSVDGGRTWSFPADVAAGLPSPGRFRLKNADPAFGSVPGRGFRSNSFPTATIGPNGVITVAWVDFPAGACTNDGSGRPPCTNADVRSSVSRNGGRTWSAPAKVSDDTGTTDQFFPWAAAHPDGRVSLIWQDKRLDPANADFDTFYTTASGTTFAPNVRVSSATSRIGTATFIGDYNYVATLGDVILPVWTDRRDRNNDIFTAVGVR